MHIWRRVVPRTNMARDGLPNRTTSTALLSVGANGETGAVPPHEGEGLERRRVVALPLRRGDARRATVRCGFREGHTAEVAVVIGRRYGGIGAAQSMALDGDGCMAR